MLRVIVITAAYLLGSIPFGYLIVNLAGRGDVRNVGSGGTGATNVTRSAGKTAGILTLVLDALKGVAAVLLARWLLAESMGANWWVAGAAFAVVVGHCFPVWLSFRGGKGVATGLGVFLSLAPLAVLCSLPIFILVVWATRYVSLGSIIAAAFVPLMIFLLGNRASTPDERAPILFAATMGAALIIFMHRANIGRLLSGTENKWK